MTKPNFRKMARSFQSEDGTTLKELMAQLASALDELPGGKADAVERAIVEHLQNALRDEFGLACDLESAWGDEDSEDAAS